MANIFAGRLDQLNSIVTLLLLTGTG